jgi:hypothetical protein
MTTHDQPAVHSSGDAQVAAAMEVENGKQIIAYHVSPDLKMPLVRASSERAWMDATRQRFAYRCLPLLMGNQHGWWILSHQKVKIWWDGDDLPENLHIKYAKGSKPPFAAVSHFGHGILTFLIPYLFRTPPGYNMVVRGPTNMPKDGIQALDGIVETDWAVATASMNWIFTRTDTPVVFEKDEPICMVYPVRRGDLESFDTELRSLASNPELERNYLEWSDRRARFNQGLKQADSPEAKQGWERDYFRGRFEGVEAPQHQTKLNLNDFRFKG